MPEAAADAAESLWAFSLRVYGSPGVAEACLALQDRHGSDVNLLLFALWHGASGRGALAQEALAAADDAVEEWRRQAVEPLRGVRRYLKGRDAEALRAQVKAAELDSERLEQAMLATHAAAERTVPGPVRTADSLAGAASYLARLLVPVATTERVLGVLGSALEGLRAPPPKEAS